VGIKSQSAGWETDKLIDSVEQSPFWGADSFSTNKFISFYEIQSVMTVFARTHLGLIILLLFDEEYKLLSMQISSSSWYFFWGPDIHLSALFSNTSVFIKQVFRFNGEGCGLLGCIPHRISVFFLLFPSSGILENTTFRKLDLFPSSGEGGWEETDPISETLCSLEHQTMEKVQKPTNSVCYTPSSESF
jgi:hypothetical protein